jgi:hypothetical protein
MGVARDVASIISAGRVALRCMHAHRPPTHSR